MSMNKAAALRSLAKKEGRWTVCGSALRRFHSVK
jgi:hypothetical protein